MSYFWFASLQRGIKVGTFALSVSTDAETLIAATIEAN